MRTFIKYIVSVIIISIVSYFLQVLWVKIVEPIMESNGIMFQGILPEGQIISGIAVILINIVGAVVLGVLFNGNIPIWLCLFYNILYTVFLLIYTPDPPAWKIHLHAFLCEDQINGSNAYVLPL